MTGGHSMSFEQLINKNSLPASHLFRYLQIRHFIKSCLSTFADIPRHNTIENITNVRRGSKRAVAILYQTLISHESTSTDRSRTRSRCSVNARHNLIQFKVIHRLHYSKVKVSQMYPSVSALCNKCKNQEGTLRHQYWTCPSLILVFCI